MSDFQVTMSTGGDIPPESMNFNGEGDYCQVCNAGPLYYAGKGRHPKFCDEHKTSKGNSPSTRNANMKAVEDKLGDLYRTIGLGVSMIDGFSGMAIANGADDLAKSWIQLAETNPKVKKFLVKATTGAGIGGVILAHGLVFFPIAQHHGLTPSFLSKKNTGYGDTGP